MRYLNSQPPSFSVLQCKVIIVSVLLCLFCSFDAYALNLDKAEMCFLNEDYFSAIDECEKILARNKNSRELDRLYYLLGVSYMKTGNLLRASDIFDIIINEYPHSELAEDAYICRGDSYLLMGDLNKAKEDYSFIIKHCPKSDLKAATYYKLVQVCLKQGDWTTSKLYSETIKRDFPLSFESRLLKDLTNQDYFFSIQVGAFLNRENAENLEQELQKKGFSAYIVEEVSNSRKFYKVRVGKIENRNDALKLERELADLGYPTRIYP